MLIPSVIFKDKSKYSACDLKCRLRVFTLWGIIIFSQFISHDKSQMNLRFTGVYGVQSTIVLTLFPRTSGP